MYFCEIENDYPEKLIGKYDGIKSGDRFELKKCGVPEGFRRPHYIFDCDMKNLMKFDDLANSALVPLVSEKISKVLEFFYPEVQLVPSTIQAKDGLIDTYNSVIALNMVEAIDFRNSEFILIPGTSEILKFNRLFLRSNALGGLNIARVKEYNSFLLISEKLKLSFEKARARRMGIYSVEQVSL